MSHDWPGRWEPALPDHEPGIVVDHGHRYLIGDTPEAYLSLSGDIPVNTC